MLIGDISKKFDTISQFTASKNFCSFDKKEKIILKEEKNDFINLIYIIAKETTYNAFHYNAIKIFK